MKLTKFIAKTGDRVLALKDSFLRRINIGFKGAAIVISFVFICSFFYLHQKVGIYVCAYQLNDNYNHYEELAAKRDYLMYAFNKETSLPKINQWVSKNNFSFDKKEKILALNLRQRARPRSTFERATSVFNRVISVPAGVGTAMARNE